MTRSIAASTSVLSPLSSVEDGARTLTPDEIVLASLGYKQEFRREFSPLEVFGVAFSIIGVVPSIASVLIFAIPNGGPSAMVWGWAFSSFMILSVGLAMAELGSAAPTSGGLYYWTHKLSSPRCRNLLAWIVGYANTIGLMAGVASIGWGCAVQVMAAVSINSGLTFSPTTRQIFGVYVAILFCTAVVASMATRVLARMQNVYIALNVLLCLAIIIALPAATPKELKNNAGYALGGFKNFNGWPDGYAFILSFLAPLWSIAGYDSAVHISEEATNARTAVPFAIIASITTAGVLGWAINVAIAFNMGTDIESILSSPIGQPLAAIFFNSFGQKGTLVIWSFIVFVQFLTATSLLLASSRQTFAFARDGGLPFSAWIHRVNRRTQTPVNGVWCAALVALLLGLLAFAGPSAISAVFALGIAAQNVAYAVPFAARFAFANDFRPGPFRLGRFSLPVTVTAVLWMSFTTVVLFFPTTPQTNAADMNYCVVVLGGTLLLAVGYYYCPRYGGVHWFIGPVSTISDAGSEVVGGGEKTREDDNSESWEKN